MKPLFSWVTGLLMLMPGVCWSSFISMDTSFTVAETREGLVLTVSSQNRGDEPSFAVQFEVTLGDRVFTGPTVSRLAINETTHADFRIEGNLGLPGRYPVVIKTHYQDANSYPFSALAVGFYDHQAPVVSRLKVRAEDVSIPSNGKGRLGFVVHNSESVQRDIDISLHLPDELVVVEETRRVTIPARESAEIHYTVENFSALENSGYSVILVAEYEDGSHHYSKAGSAIVRIAPPSALAGWAFWVIVSTGGVLVLLAVVLYLRRGRVSQR